MIKHVLTHLGKILVGSFLLLLVACSSKQASPIAEESLQVALTSTRTRIPASATATILPSTLTPTLKPTRTATRTLHPTRTPVIASRPEDILGLWLGIENRDGMYHQFNADGTCRVSKVRDTLETNPNVICNYWFEDSNLVIEDVEVQGLPKCGSPGIYKVELLPTGELDISVVDDRCTPRARTTGQLHESRD